MKFHACKCHNADGTRRSTAHVHLATVIYGSQMRVAAHRDGSPYFYSSSAAASNARDSFERETGLRCEVHAVSTYYLVEVQS